MKLHAIALETKADVIATQAANKPRLRWRFAARLLHALQETQRRRAIQLIATYPDLFPREQDVIAAQRFIAGDRAPPRQPLSLTHQPRRPRG